MWSILSRAMGYGLPLFTELAAEKAHSRQLTSGNPSRFVTSPAWVYVNLSNKRASLKEAKRDVNRGFDCFSYLEQGQHRSNRRKGAVETWQKLKPSA